MLVMQALLRAGYTLIMDHVIMCFTVQTNVVLVQSYHTMHDQGANLVLVLCWTLSCQLLHQSYREELDDETRNARPLTNMDSVLTCLLESAEKDTADGGLLDQFIDPVIWKDVEIGLSPEATVALKQGLASLATIQLRKTLIWLAPMPLLPKW